MCKVGKIILKVFAILAAIAGVVAAVYYWNLDQKLLDWFYKKTNDILRERTDMPAILGRGRGVRRSVKQ